MEGAERKEGKEELGGEEGEVGQLKGEEAEEQDGEEEEGMAGGFGQVEGLKGE